jgi:GTP-binding protein HflX
MTTSPRWADEPSTFPDNDAIPPGSEAGGTADAALRGTSDTPHDIEHDDLVVDDPTTGEFGLDDRISVRRVGGLSTELEDVSEVEYRQLRLERVVLVGVWTDGSVDDAANSLVELAALAETAGSQVLEGLVQRRSRPDACHRLRQGGGARRALDRRRHRDLRRWAVGPRAAQPGGQVKVRWWATALILDIFAQHARHEGGPGRAAGWTTCPSACWLGQACPVGPAAGPAAPPAWARPGGQLETDRRRIEPG